MRVAALVLCLPAIVFAQPSVDEEAVWTDFTGWLRNQPPNSKPGDLTHAYRENLVAEGVPEGVSGVTWR